MSDRPSIMHMAPDAPSHPWFVLNLRAAMERSGIENGNQLANRLGMHRTTVGRWLDGAVPEGPNLPRLAAVLGVTVNELLEEPKDPAETLARVVRMVRREVGSTEATVLELMARLPPEVKVRLLDRIVAWVEALS